MSCHFHKLRRLKAAEAAQKVAEATQSAETVKGEEKPTEQPEAAQKSAKGRRKGDA